MVNVAKEVKEVEKVAKVVDFVKLKHKHVDYFCKLLSYSLFWC